jgi:hypothetical protein
MQDIVLYSQSLKYVADSLSWEERKGKLVHIHVIKASVKLEL